jgi:hypothetical protein
MSLRKQGHCNVVVRGRQEVVGAYQGSWVGSLVVAVAEVVVAVGGIRVVEVVVGSIAVAVAEVDHSRIRAAFELMAVVRKYRQYGHHDRADMKRCNPERAILGRLLNEIKGSLKLETDQIVEGSPTCVLSSHRRPSFL